MTGRDVNLKAKLILAISGGAMMAVLAGANVAYAADTQLQADAGNAPGDIVVTAQKTSSVAAKTPVAMNILSGEQARSAGVHDLSSLATTIPAVTFTTSAEASALIGIRGVLSQSDSEIGDPAVAVGVDNFFANRTYTLNQSLYDLARIEVLRGPQGTLYGRNAIGGVINFITQKPTKDFEGYASVTAGTYSTVNSEGAINVPIGDKVQVRASWGTSSHGAYCGNTQQIGGNDRNSSASGRVAVAFQPTDRFDGLISLQYTQTDGTSGTFQEIPFVNNATNTDIVHQMPAGAYARSWGTMVPFYLGVNDFRVHWDFNYQLSDLLKLNYNGGYDAVHYNYQQSNDDLINNVARKFLQHEVPLTQSHEIRLSSDETKRFSFQTGFYYFNESSSLDSGTQALYNGQFVRRSHYVDPSVKTESEALFAQGNFKILENLKLSAGLRQTWDARSRVGTASYFTNGVQSSTATQNGNVKTDRLTYHVGLDWNATPTTFVYGKLDTGYKAGGFNTSGILTFPYGPETSTVWEGGVKQQLFSHKGLLSVTGFHNNYKGYQADLGLCTLCNNTIAGIVNAGTAEIWGIESSFDLKVKPIGLVNLSVNYLSAKFTKFDGTYTNQQTDGTGTTVPVNLAGNTLPQAPRWTISGGLQHDFPLGELGNLRADIKGSYRTKQNFSIYNFAENEQKGYFLGDAYVEYKPNNGRYSVQAYVHNFTNKQYLVFSTDNSGNGAYLYGYGDPRVIGVKVTGYFK
ncbi:TonB-dependent receptor [Novosphingobium rosa]|uniref:TonB-dependent receptor n=1 Tax=Novosphingobium rosa TaxID=76978 RepID=UPI00082DE037|nr:TonB-dependent receptor [Novosphingobium rosa]